MGKKFLLFVVLISAMVFMMNAHEVSAQNPAVSAPAVAVTAAPAPASVPQAQVVVPSQAPVRVVTPAPQKVASNTTASNRAALAQIGFGFNGIPLDGSHLQALRMRRAYRQSHGF